MKLSSMLALLALALAAGPACGASADQLAIADPGLKAPAALKVASPKLSPGAPIPGVYSAYGQSVSPPLSWSGAPANTSSFALVVEDPDAPMPSPFVHWMAWNIGASAKGLAEGQVPAGTRQGKLMFVGKVGYMGPRPPAGPAHHYHFQVFALDQVLGLQDGAERPVLVAAMKGHVLASGELVATYQKP